MRVGILSLLLLTSVACSPAQRATAGAVMGGVGLEVAGGSIDSMMFPACLEYQEPYHSCVWRDEPLSPKVGLPLLAGGLGVALTGGVLLVSALPRDRPPTQTPTMPAPPDEPTVLDETDAVGMAIAHLVLVGLESDAKPSKLLGVDDAQVRLRADDRHAELWNLRIRTVADETWRSVGACYEYEHEWQLTSLRTTPECP
jgi:hypothetical protein